ncbi:Crp/Fnr family transcriptional regulator [Streptomyces sp. NPDC058374]|uniref:Crp/Fnr family transcriptional regulator n=1 Tax=Streptomyces sp. NPDC058374 TaxID=3346466 RepID=UPI0036473005
MRIFQVIDLRSSFMLDGHHLAPNTVFDSRCINSHERLGERIPAELRGLQRVRFEKGQPVYMCGGTDSSIYVIESGLVKTSMYSREGKEHLAAIHSDGEIFGEQCLVSTERTETATAMTETSTRRIPNDHFMRVMEEQGLLTDFIKCLTARLLDQRQVATELVTLESEHRLASTLLRLSQKFGKQRGDRILIGQRFTQEELSRMMGTTRSRVGYFLKRFRSIGLITENPHGLIEINEERTANYVNLHM